MTPQRSTFVARFLVLTLFGFIAHTGMAAAIAAPSDPGTKMIPQNFAALAGKVGPAVVNIQVEKATQPAMYPFNRGSGDRGRHFRDFFGPHFRDQRSRPHRQSGLGTGFIIAPEGYIVTNNHVVDGAEKIKVVLQDERQFEAEVIGRDPQTDLALIKVDSDRNLPAVALGRSSDLAVGEWVVAIGNPFGLDHTVTAGIVSAKGRVIGSGPYDDYIQTDASINPGNSGGPLLNMQGEVVGINTAIIASGQGIGFAIPIDMANGVISQLRKEGEVTRGWLGISIQDLKGDLAAYYGVEKGQGVLVTQVVPGDPADKAGIRTRDIITAIDGTPMGSSRELTAKAAGLTVDDKVDVDLLRNGKPKTVSLQVGRRPLTLAQDGKSGAEKESEYGIRVSDLTPEMARELNIENAGGAVVTGIKPGSQADKAGLRQGDVIIEVNRQAIDSAQEFKERITQAKKDADLNLLVKRGQAGLKVIPLG
ncbi:MAG: DegQ family serine endoprotease [Desulfobacterales bacterium]|nr:DegQ family serine endoprotease [Desulfobacterales bacterium]